MSPIKPKPSADQSAEVAGKAPGVVTNLSPELPQMSNDIKPNDLPQPDAATIAFYESNGIPYCKQCGMQVVSDTSNKIFCPHSADDCPVVNK
jgi:hypothetical protein